MRYPHGVPHPSKSPVFRRMAGVSDSAFSSLNAYISSAAGHSTQADLQAALDTARADASEYGLSSPGVALGSLLGTLAAVGEGGAVAMTPAAGVVGLHILAGLPEKSNLTCIDPEADHQARAKATFRDAGFGPSRTRFLPSRPLDVLGRLATESYHLVVADVEPVDLPAVVEAAWPLLTPGGTLVLLGSLLDGTLVDASRTDRNTTAAREADALIDTLDGALVTRLPLDAGVTLITRAQ